MASGRRPLRLQTWRNEQTVTNAVPPLRNQSSAHVCQRPPPAPRLEIPARLQTRFAFLPRFRHRPNASNDAMARLCAPPSHRRISQGGRRAWSGLRARYSWG
jgi:hypothetical protein